MQNVFVDTQVRVAHVVAHVVAHLFSSVVHAHVNVASYDLAVQRAMVDVIDVAYDVDAVAVVVDDISPIAAIDILL